jgi:hypothetical protein
MRARAKKLIWIAPLAILGIVVFISVGGEIVRLLWNWLLPPLLGWPRITFWEAIGILALCRILFGGAGWHGPVRSNIRGRMKERWESLTPEERERFRQRMCERWGSCSSTGESKEDMK